MTKTVYCNNCPAIVVFQPNIMICGLTEYKLTYKSPFEYHQDESDCPLKQIELKDGFVYEPEVQE